MIRTTLIGLASTAYRLHLVSDLLSTKPYQESPILRLPPSSANSRCSRLHLGRHPAPADVTEKPNGKEGWVEDASNYPVGLWVAHTTSR